MRATPIRSNQSKQLAPKSLRPVVLAPLAVLLALAGCADQTAAPVETTAAIDAPRYGAAKVDTTGMADAAMDAAGDAMPKATADTMMAALMVEASQIDSPTPDMRAYGRCVGISDYMTAHSTAKDRSDWAKDSRKLEASAEAMPDYNAGVFSSERENTLFKMAEALRAMQIDPDGTVTKARSKALARDIAACLKLTA